jgi:hypothetical protein
LIPYRLFSRFVGVLTGPAANVGNIKAERRGRTLQDQSCSGTSRARHSLAWAQKFNARSSGASWTEISTRSLPKPTQVTAAPQRSAQGGLAMDRPARVHRLAGAGVSVSVQRLVGMRGGVRRPAHPISLWRLGGLVLSHPGAKPFSLGGIAGVVIAAVIWVLSSQVKIPAVQRQKRRRIDDRSAGSHLSENRYKIWPAVLWVRPEQGAVEPGEVRGGFRRDRALPVGDRHCVGATRYPARRRRVRLRALGLIGDRVHFVIFTVERRMVWLIGLRKG